MGLIDGLKHAWNAFRNKDPTYSNEEYRNLGLGYSYRPDRFRVRGGNDRTIINSIFTRIAMDAAAIRINHVELDEHGRYSRTKESPLNDCLTLEANGDQTGRAFIQDIVESVLQEGCIAIVPTETDSNPRLGSFDVYSMRVAKITQWYPADVEVRLYNDFTGQMTDIKMPKRSVAIVENPLYTTVNQPNSVFQRLIRKLALLDAVDEQSSSGKLDLIIQLPYVIKSEARREQANRRREEIEDQLTGSKYGIAWTDGTEKVTQLNRSLENNLLTQVQYLTEMLYSQLGITASIMDGSADDKTMLNYYNRTIEPIVSSIADEIKRKFLSKTARSRGQSIMYFRDPFKLVPVNELAEIADKMTRNEIMTSNEMRQVIGLVPSSDPEADVLRNKNLNKNDNVAEDQQGGPDVFGQSNEEMPNNGNV